MKSSIYIRCFILLAATFNVVGVLAEDIPYEIRAFGANHLALTLNYDSPASLIVTPSSDGKTLRISGVGVTFTNKNSDKTPALINSLNTLKRDNFTDLVVGLNTPAEFTSTPSTKSLQIFMSASTPGSENIIQIAQSKVSATNHNIVINFPAISAKTKLSAIFQSLAIALDTFYSNFIDSKDKYLGKDLADFPNEIDKGSKISVENRGGVSSNGF